MKELTNKCVLLDRMEYLSSFPDLFFDLVVDDPPYGIGEDGSKNKTRGKHVRQKNGSKAVAKAKDYTTTAWDKEPPPPEYFDLVFRKSKNQIFWGANHYITRIGKDSSCWLVWDKDNGQTDFADVEMAWTSFKGAARLFKFRWSGMLQGNMKNKEIRIHATQKPVALYKWTLAKYAKPGQKIGSFHVGSGSDRIACYELGMNFWGCENNHEIFAAQEKRFNNHIKQLNLFL